MVRKHIGPIDAILVTGWMLRRYSSNIRRSKTEGDWPVTTFLCRKQKIKMHNGPPRQTRNNLKNTCDTTTKSNLLIKQQHCVAKILIVQLLIVQVVHLTSFFSAMFTLKWHCSGDFDTLNLHPGLFLIFPANPSFECAGPWTAPLL